PDGDRQLDDDDQRRLVDQEVAGRDRGQVHPGRRPAVFCDRLAGIPAGATSDWRRWDPDAHRSVLTLPARQCLEVDRVPLRAIAQVALELGRDEETARLQRLEGASERVDLPEREVALAPALERIADPAATIAH